MTASRSTSGRRAQVVLAAAVVVATALVPMLIAYLQLGYPADPAADRSPDRLVDARHALDRATTRGAVRADGLNWTNRLTAFQRANATVETTMAHLEAGGAPSGTVVEVAYNDTAANSVTDRSCPAGENRAFGECVAAEGVVLQERAGTVAVVAVAVDVRVRSPRTDSLATVVFRPY